MIKINKITDFTISDEDQKLIDEWDHCRSTNVSGGRLTYSFSPCGLGLIVKIHCCECERELNLTRWEYFG